MSPCSELSSVMFRATNTTDTPPGFNRISQQVNIWFLSVQIHTSPCFYALSSHRTVAVSSAHTVWATQCGRSRSFVPGKVRLCRSGAPQKSIQSFLPRSVVHTNSSSGQRRGSSASGMSGAVLGKVCRSSDLLTPRALIQKDETKGYVMKCSVGRRTART